MCFPRIAIPYLIFILCSLYFCSFCQITYERAAGESITKAAPYDSLDEIITADNYGRYIGQGVYFPIKSKKYREYEVNQQYYQKFNLNKDPYDKVEGKSLVIVDIINHLDKNKYDYNHTGLFFILKDPVISDTFDYQVVLDKNYVYSDPHPMFHFSGYLEKLKQINVSKTFIAKTDLTGLKDMVTGQPVSCNRGSLWVCTELTMIETTEDVAAKPVYVFKDSLLHQITVATGGIKSKGIDATLDDFDMKKTGAVHQKLSKQKTKNKNSAP